MQSKRKLPSNVSVFLSFLLLLAGLLLPLANAVSSGFENPHPPGYDQKKVTRMKNATTHINRTTGVVINEFMSSNIQTLADPNGAFHDWIELYNTSGDTVNLAGWALTDNPAEPFKWVFPETEILPGGFLMVWASGENILEGPLHTNFSISSEGELLLLVHPSGNWADMINPIALPNDISYGRQPDGSNGLYYFMQASPGYPNTYEPFSGIAPAPAFSAPGGFHSGSFFLSLEHQDPDVAIVYTLDGSDPDPMDLTGNTYFFKNQYAFYPDSEMGQLLEDSVRSFLYNEPILIENREWQPDKLTGKSSTVQAPNYFPQDNVFKGTVVKARAYKAGMLPGQMVTQTYFVSPEGNERYSLPVVALSLHEALLFDYHKGIYTPGFDADKWREQNPNTNYRWPFPGNFHRRGSEWEYPAYLEYFLPGNSLSVLNQSFGIRLHGGGTRSFPMKSFRLYARNSYGEEYFQFPFFQDNPHTSFKRLLLRNSGQDFPTDQWWANSPSRTMFRDALMQNVVKHLNFETQDYQPVIVFINGEYWGIHNIRERYDKHYLQRVYDIEPERLDLLTHRNTINEGDNDHYLETLQYIEEFGLQDDVHFQFIATRIDTESFMDYQIANIYLRNTDWPGNNIDFWRYRTHEFKPDNPHGKDGRWRWLMYDTDFGFGLVEGPDAFTHNTLAFATMEGGTNWPNPDWSTFLLRSFLANETFRVNFINRFADLLNTSFAPDYIMGQIEEMKRILAPEMAEHLARWSPWQDIEHWKDHVGVLDAFARNRAYHQRKQIREYFSTDSLFTVTLDISHPLHGHIRVNTLDLKAQTRGISEEPYPWQGIYFGDVPLTIAAQPMPGYRFSHWEGDIGGTDPEVVIAPGADLNLKAFFETTGEENLVSYWHLDDQLPNNTPLQKIAPFYSIVQGARLVFESCLEGYPFGPGHELWRKGSMERRNSPTPVNYRSEAVQNSPWNPAQMRAIQVKQPLAYGDSESAIVLHLPTAFIRDAVLRFAAKDEGAAIGLLVDYRSDTTEAWTTFRDGFVALGSNYQLYEFDLGKLPETVNNPHLKVRIRFVSRNSFADDGKRVVFNNFSLDGVVCMAHSFFAGSTENGHVFPGGRSDVSACGSQNFTIVPAENHIIENVWLDGLSIMDRVLVDVSGMGVFEFSDAIHDHQLWAQFQYDPILLDSIHPVVVYPNPTSGKLFVASDEDIERIRLYDIAGRLLYDQEMLETGHTISTEHLVSGIYFLTIYSDTKMYTRKIQIILSN